MYKYIHSHSSILICISCLFYAEIDSNFQYVENVTALNRLLERTLRFVEIWQETSGLWEQGRCHNHLGLCNRHINCMLL